MKKKKHFDSGLKKYEIIRPYLEKEISLASLAFEHYIGLRTLRRWVELYEQKGLSGLQRKPRVNKGKRSTISKEFEQLVEAYVLQKPPITLSAIHRKIIKVATAKNIPPPTYYVVRDIAKNLDPALVLLAQQGSKAYGEVYELIHRREANAPNEIWQADHSPIDIVLLDDKGVGRKPWLTTIIDDYSRAICGYFLSFDDPNTLHVSLALRQAIWLKTDKRWQVCGIPGILYTDNGSDFISLHIKQVAADLKIQLKNSIPGKPQGRGRVERFFLTLSQLLLMNLPGYTPPKTTFAPGTLTLEEFTGLFEKFILEEYHHKIHSTTNQAPLERWQNNSFLPHLPQSLEQLDLLLLTVIRPRKVHQDGIYFQKFTYIDTNLAAYVGESVAIRYDPRDLAEIRVFHNDKFLCRAICPQLSDKLVSLKEIIKARQKRKRELRKTITERKTLAEQFSEEKKIEIAHPKTIPKSEEIKKNNKLKHYQSED